MERLRHVTPEYQNRLKDLAHLLCPLNEVVEVNPLSIPRDEEYDIDYTYRPFQTIVEDTQQGWDSLGDYHCPSLRTEHVNG